MARQSAKHAQQHGRITNPEQARQAYIAYKRPMLTSSQQEIADHNARVDADKRNKQVLRELGLLVPAKPTYIPIRDITAEVEIVG